MESRPDSIAAASSRLFTSSSMRAATFSIALAERATSSSAQRFLSSAARPRMHMIGFFRSCATIPSTSSFASFARLASAAASCCARWSRARWRVKSQASNALSRTPAAPNVSIQLERREELS
jgi:hypothetical protein